MHFLVLKVQRGLQQHLIKTMYRYAEGLRLSETSTDSICSHIDLLLERWVNLDLYKRMFLGALTVAHQTDVESAGAERTCSRT